MKTSQLRSLIREEVQKTLSEQTTLTPKSSEQEVKQAVADALTKLEKAIDDKAKNVTVRLDKKKPTSGPQNIPYKDIMLVRVGFGDLKKIIDEYKEVAKYGDLYFDRLNSNDAFFRKDAPNILKELIDILAKISV